jgi:hypothetical protein
MNVDHVPGGTRENMAFPRVRSSLGPDLTSTFEFGSTAKYTEYVQGLHEFSDQF